MTCENTLISLDNLEFQYLAFSGETFILALKIDYSKMMIPLCHREIFSIERKDGVYKIRQFAWLCFKKTEVVNNI